MFHARRLHPALRPWLDSVVGYDMLTAPDLVHHGLPSSGLTVILAFDEPLDCGWQGGSRALSWVLVGGLHTAPAIIHTHGVQRGIQLALSPLGARRLLGLPAAELANTLALDDEVSLAFPMSLHLRLQDASWPMRLRLMEEHLLRLVTTEARLPDVSPAVAHAWRSIQSSHGQVLVAEVADEVGWSRRHLTQRFSAEFGVTPKVAARLSRFERAVQLARASVPLADVAAACGYADQPHLNREWRQFAGHTPSETLGEFPIVQDLS